MDVTFFRDTSDAPRRPTPDGSGGHDERPGREPVFNSPWPALLLVGLIVGAYAVQTLFPMDLALGTFAFSPAGLAAGRWGTVLTALFLHGGWSHALMNAGFALAFAPPVSRLLGERLGGVVAFFAFYLICGVVANLAFAAVHPGSDTPLVGASGAVSGLMAAAARVMAGQGRLGPILSRLVLGMGAAWIVVNLIVAVVGGSLLPGVGGAGVAWEAHIAGFLVGLLLIGPVAWIAQRT